MRYLTLACDYDGTVAHHGELEAETIAALERLLASGRRLVLVTGRIVDDLERICPRLDLFEWVVAENGGVLYRPRTKETIALSERPPDRLAELLARRGVTPLSIGRVIVATWEPHESTVLSIIKELGLELQVIFNKGAVMVLPAGITKASGLEAALRAMDLSPHNVVGVGDAENDHAFLRLCECSVAVANALPGVKETADVVTRAGHGPGVAELVDAILADDLAGIDRSLTRHHLRLGTGPNGQDVTLPSHRANLLVAGPSGSGKSTIVTALLERLVEARYQVCIIDPEGDYSGFEHAQVVGTATEGPAAADVIQHLKLPDQHVVANLVGVPFADRPAHFGTLLALLEEHRARTGRPHWIVVDEAHHLVPASWEPPAITLSPELDRLLFVTVDPATMSSDLLTRVTHVLAVGADPIGTIRAFGAEAGEAIPALERVRLDRGELLLWERGHRTATRVKLAPGKSERRRHSRKYAEGELPADRSFYFRGPDGALNLRAQNLTLFLQIADGVDDRTWTYHLDHRDYSRWIRNAIKDDELAADVELIERQIRLPATLSRAAIREAIERRYTLPAGRAAVPATDA
jgi:HAD superfamily hydrolase (TIGR01484 family)